MTATKQYDVMIAGAGPAGCAAAIILRQAGFSVCLADPVMDGELKMGESLPGAAIRLLNRLGIAGLEDLLPEKDFKCCVANASAWGSNHWIYQDAVRSPEGGGWHINRNCFDAALRKKAKQAGVHFYAAQVILLDHLSDAESSLYPYYVKLKTNRSLPEGIRAKWLIDATGRKAFLSRQRHIPRERADNQMVVVSWVRASEDDPDPTTRIKSVANGWWYTTQLPNGSRVISFHGLSADIAAMEKQPLSFFSAFNKTGMIPYPIHTSQLIEMKASAAGIARAEQAAVSGLLCVGDAALSFDPLSSQGIFFALYSGIKGAEAITGLLNEPGSGSSLLQKYQLQVDRVYEANQRSGKYFYVNESRYASEAYWQSRMKIMGQLHTRTPAVSP